MVDGKHMPGCGVTRNETINKHEKPNGVSNFFIKFSVTCVLRFVPAGPEPPLLLFSPSQLTVTTIPTVIFSQKKLNFRFH